MSDARPAKAVAAPALLVRYGMNHNHGPHDPLLEEMPDGYWTPWHIAAKEIERLRQRVKELETELYEDPEWPEPFVTNPVDGLS